MGMDSLLSRLENQRAVTPFATLAGRQGVMRKALIDNARTPVTPATPAIANLDACVAQPAPPLATVPVKAARATTPQLAVRDTEPAPDLPLLAALAEFDQLIERLCDLSRYPADVREAMRQARRHMAPGRVAAELDAVRDLVKKAEAGEATGADDRITCRECTNRRHYDGVCTVARIGGPVNAVRGHVPDALLRHRCAGFKPNSAATDSRSGAQRWPHLNDQEENYDEP